jgi:hypothetical protein
MSVVWSDIMLWGSVEDAQSSRSQTAQRKRVSQQVSALSNNSEIIIPVNSVRTRNNSNLYSQSLLYYIPIMTSNQIANILWSLGRMRCNWSDGLSLEFQQSLLTRLNTVLSAMSPYELLWSIWALGSMNVVWSRDIALIPNLKENILFVMGNASRMFSQKELGILLWALVKVKCPADDFPLKLRKDFVDNVENLLAKKNRF